MATTTESISAAQSWYSIQNKKESDEAEILIYDVIGAWGISADRFVRDFKAIDAKRIVIGINSPGGGVDDGTAIYNAIKSHPAYVTTRIDGTAASAASFIAAAGDTVRMADNTYFMIHDASGGVMGGSEDMRRFADLLEKVNDNIAGMYEKKTGKDRKYWRDKMSAETWFNAEEAKAEGLVDEVFAASKAPEKAKAAFDFKIYNKIPDAVKTMWGLSNQNSPPAPEPSQSSEPAQAILKETQPMAETSTLVAPAQTPAAGTSVTQGETTQQQIARLNDGAIQSFIEKGKIVGRAEGRAALMDELRAIVAAAPGRPQTALNAILAGQNAATTKLVVDAEMNAEMQANKRAQEQEVEIAKLRADQARLMELNNLGGFPGGVAASVYAPAAMAAVSAPSGLEPEAQAKLEWDGDPMIRAKCTEKQWLLYRANQLSGRVRALSRQSA